MLKIKKKPFFLTLFVFFSVLIIAVPLFFSYLSGYFLKSYSKKILGQEISYSSLNFENGKIVAKNISGSSDTFDIKISEVFFKIKLDIFAFAIKSDITLIKPEVILKKRKDAIVLNENLLKAQKKIIKSKINVKDGRVKILENGSIYYFALEQKDFNDTFSLIFGFDEKFQKKIDLQIKKQNENILAFLEFTKVPSDLLLKFVAYFKEPSLKKMEGEISGSMKFKLREKKKSSVLFDLALQDFSIEDLNKRTFGAKKIELKGDTYSKLAKSILGKNCPLRLKGNIEKGFVFSAMPLLEEINGSIFYSPELGPNVDLKAIAVIDGEKKPISLESRGYFNSNFCNWADIGLSFSKDKDSGVFLKFLEKNDTIVMQVKMEDVGNEYFYLFQNIFPGFSNFKVLGGQINLDGQAEIKSNRIEKVALENIELKETSFQIGEFKCLAGSVKGSLDLDLKDATSSISSKLLISNASIDSSKGAFKELLFGYARTEQVLFLRHPQLLMEACLGIPPLIFFPFRALA